MGEIRGLAGHVALVTGGSRGIGAAIARALAVNGADVVVNYRLSADAAAGVVEACEESGVRAIAVRADVTRTQEVEQLFATAEQRLGPVDILINNAGVSLRALVAETSDEDWERVMDANLKSAFLCCRRALPGMIRRRHGRIINIASVWGLTGAAYEAVYAAAKGGLVAFTKSLAREVGTAGILVNAIAPGPVESDMLCRELGPAERAALADAIPSGRLGRPEDVAAACVFLASREASFINGHVLRLDGGWLP
ncbi:MAG: 3-oxoacyl-ACP reductase FabG [Thermoanaerobacterales bacterium]|nr:3-oxoacyl-ACP reductase FabG [Thermoanaerobacterales bacterium]